MLDSGKKIALCATKKINILTLVSEKKIPNEKNHNPPPPLQVNWWSLILKLCVRSQGLGASEFIFYYIVQNSRLSGNQTYHVLRFKF